MREFIPIAVIVVSLVAACGGSSAGAEPSGPAHVEPGQPAYVQVFEVQLHDGRVVTCVFASGNYQGGGVSCDFNPESTP